MENNRSLKGLRNTLHIEEVSNYISHVFSKNTLEKLGFRKDCIGYLKVLLKYQSSVLLTEIKLMNIRS